MNGTPSPQTNVSSQFVTEKLPVGWPWRLLVFSIVIFAFTLLVFFGIKFGYTAFLDKKSSDLDSSLNKLSEEVSVTDQSRFVGFYSQIVNLKSVLDRHLFSANLFTFLEQNVIDGVVFTEAKFSGLDRALNLQGTASSFDAIAQQMAVFAKVREVQKVLLEDANVGSGNAAFRLSVVFTDAFFKKLLTP
ncbi:MAG: hypothetical protein V1696_01290 [Candidatus Jorgensenbacteria bacterium]